MSDSLFLSLLILNDARPTSICADAFNDRLLKAARGEYVEQVD